MSTESVLVRTINVMGTPRPQGSMRLFKNGGAAYSNTTYQWRNQVTAAACSAGEDAAWEPYTGSLGLRVTFYLKRPQIHSTAKGLRPNAPRYPGKAPDLDKLCRLVGDALTDAGCVWRDDGQVVLLDARKLYAGTRPPGVSIEVWEVG